MFYMTSFNVRYQSLRRLGFFLAGGYNGNDLVVRRLGFSTLLTGLYVLCAGLSILNLS
jgi:hypothetical protein